MGESSRRQQAAGTAPNRPRSWATWRKPVEPSPTGSPLETLRGRGKGGEQAEGPRQAEGLQSPLPGRARDSTDRTGSQGWPKSRHLRMPPARLGSSFPQHPLQGCEAWRGCARQRTEQHLPWMTASVGGDSSGRKTNTLWEGGSRQQMLGGRATVSGGGQGRLAGDWAGVAPQVPCARPGSAP